MLYTFGNSLYNPEKYRVRQTKRESYKIHDSEKTIAITEKKLYISRKLLISAIWNQQEKGVACSGGHHSYLP